MFTPEVIEGGRVDLLSQDVTDCGVSDHIRMKKSETESQQPKTHTHTHTLVHYIQHQILIITTIIILKCVSCRKNGTKMNKNAPQTH